MIPNDYARCANAACPRAADCARLSAPLDPGYPHSFDADACAGGDAFIPMEGQSNG